MGFLTRLHAARGDFSVQVIDANKEPAKAKQIYQKVGRNTVPQIFVDGEYVGGWNELARAASTGRLDAYLDDREWVPPEPKTGLLARLTGRGNRQPRAKGEKVTFNGPPKGAGSDRDEGSPGIAGITQ